MKSNEKVIYVEKKIVLFNPVPLYICKILFKPKSSLIKGRHLIVSYQIGDVLAEKVSEKRDLGVCLSNV